MAVGRKFVGRKSMDGCREWRQQDVSSDVDSDVSQALIALASNVSSITMVDTNVTDIALQLAVLRCSSWCCNLRHYAIACGLQLMTLHYNLCVVACGVATRRVYFNFNFLISHCTQLQESSRWRPMHARERKKEKKRKREILLIYSRIRHSPIWFRFS